MEYTPQVKKIYEMVLQIDPLFSSTGTTEILERAKKLDIEIVRDCFGNISGARHIMFSREASRTQKASRGQSVPTPEGKFVIRGSFETPTAYRAADTVEGRVR